MDYKRLELFSFKLDPSFEATVAQEAESQAASRSLQLQAAHLQKQVRTLQENALQTAAANSQLQEDNAQLVQKVSKLSKALSSAQAKHVLQKDEMNNMELKL